jgi:hypothetical protein
MAVGAPPAVAVAPAFAIATAGFGDLGFSRMRERRRLVHGREA